MPKRHFATAVSLAKIFTDTREQFACAIRYAAIERIRDGQSTSVRVDAWIARHIVEPHVDEALYLIARDGLDKLEDSVRYAIDEIVREALDATRKGSPG